MSKVNKSREILLIEDNKSDAKLTRRALEIVNLNNSVVHLRDGEEALEFIFAKGEYQHRMIEDTPMLIMLDLKMPKMDGIELLEKLKQDELTKKIPIIIFTSSKEESDVETCYELGVNSYVVKPVDFDEYERVVKNIGEYWSVTNYMQ